MKKTLKPRRLYWSRTDLARFYGVDIRTLQKHIIQSGLADEMPFLCRPYARIYWNHKPQIERFLGSSDWDREAGVSA
ncbi:MAG: hypothetical protein ACK4GN_13180 [Runella sp.]